MNVGCPYTIRNGRKYGVNEFFNLEQVSEIVNNIKKHSPTLFCFVINCYNWIIDNIEYKKDIEVYGVEEHWAYPKEVLEKKQGDCEDLVILFISMLLEGGVNENNARLCMGYVEGIGNHVWAEVFFDDWYLFELTLKEKIRYLVKVPVFYHKWWNVYRSYCVPEIQVFTRSDSILVPRQRIPCKGDCVVSCYIERKT